MFSIDGTSPRRQHGGFAMNYAFTDRVRKVLAMAREEAIRLQHDHVDTEHQLLGLLRERGGGAVFILTKLSAEPERIRAQVEEMMRPGRARGVMGKLPYSSHAKKVLEFAMAEARELNHSHVGTEHLLLGLLHEEAGIAVEVLGQFGVTLERARQEAVLLPKGEPPERGDPEAGPGGWLRRLLGTEPKGGPGPDSLPITLDDTSSLSIYEQIVAQLQEAVATGRLESGDRLPTVRRLAEELDVAPGTVARAYSELERLGVVVTEGARGTRVAARPRQPLAESERPETLAGLLRPVAVAAFHLGASGEELRRALEQAMRGIFTDGEEPAGDNG
jgi:DNA-binding transcriptional regulator YhcF (GntR family)